MPRKNMPPGPGRPKGSTNKATVAAREAIAMFVEGNAHRLQEWLDQIAKKDPERAFTLFQSVIEYHIPKLARSEHVVRGADYEESIMKRVGGEEVKAIDVIEH